MTTRIDEIADGLFRISTFVPDVTEQGFSFNQFLLLGDEPMLFHCGQRLLFPLVAEAVGRIMPVERLRWISFGHVEADECGSMNQWLAAAPQVTVMHGMTACQVSLNDLADRPPRMLADGETVELGGKRVVYIDTPHVPHGWEAGVIYEEATGTLLCGDLFTHAGAVEPLTASDILGPAIEAERMFQATALTGTTAPTIRRLAAFRPARLALMHGASYEGDCGEALNGLADFYEELVSS